MMPKKKIIHVITNDVTKQFVADTITAVGASPIMSETSEEYSFIYPKIDAAVINLGMVNSEKQKVIHKACSEAQKHGIPMVIDLVGINFSAYRKTFAQSLLNQYNFHIIKGNYDEISALISEKPSSSFDASQPIYLENLQKISKLYAKSVVIATGAIDYIADNSQITTISGGSALLPKVSGTGCVLSGLLGVCLANHQLSKTECAPDDSQISGGFSLLAVENLCKAYKSASIKAEISSNYRVGQFKIDLISEISEIEVSL